MKINSLKALTSEEAKKLSIEELFTSSDYVNDLSGIANTASIMVNYYSSNPSIRVFANYIDDVPAFTNGKSININVASSIGERLTKKISLFHLMIIGLLTHELGHVYWTDFDDMVEAEKAMNKGEFYPCKPSHKNAERYEAKLKDKKYRPAIIYLFHQLDNILEDIYVNARQIYELKGTYAQGILLLNHLIAEEALTIEQEEAEDCSPLTILINALLCKLKARTVYYGSCEDKYKEKVDKITEIANEYIYSTTHSRRLEGVNLIICEVWDEVENCLDELQDESNQSQNGDSNDDNEGGNSSDNSGNGNSQSNGSNNNSGKGNSSDNGSDNGSSNSSGSSQADASGALEKIKGAMSKINKSSVEVKNGKSSDNSKEEKREIEKDLSNALSNMRNDSSDNSLASALMENPPRFEETAGVALEAEGDGTIQHLPEELKPLHSALERIVNKISAEKVLANQEKELKRKLSVTPNTSASSLHKNVNYIIGHYEKNEQNYKSVCTKIKKYIDSTTNSISRVLKEDKLTGERKNRYYGKYLNPQAYYRPDGRIFKDKKIPRKEKDVAFSILIDESGSMCGDRLYYATQAAILFAEVCEALNISYEVSGHCSSGCSVKMDVYKAFDTIDTREKYRLGNVNCNGCNRDGAAIIYSVERLMKRREPRKVFIIISDGQPSANNYYGNAAIEDLKKIKKHYSSDVDFIAAAIGDDKDIIKSIYGDSFLNISNLEMLPKAVSQLLKSKIL